jgi:hypothetical protein
MSENHELAKRMIAPHAALENASGGMRHPQAGGEPNRRLRATEHLAVFAANLQPATY